MVTCKDCANYEDPETSVQNPFIGAKVPYCKKLRIKNVWIGRAEGCNFFTPKAKEGLEEKRKKIMEMSKKEISETYGISDSYAAVLNSALKNKRFEVLNRQDLTPEEMSKELGISKSTINAYISVLKKVGLREGEE